MKKLSNALTLSTLGLLSVAGAQGKLSAQSIIVNPTMPDLSVSVRVDRDPSGNQNPTYRIGDQIALDATVNRDAYVYLFDVDPAGVVTQILPNRLSSSNFVKAGTSVRFPAPGDRFQYNVSGPAGQSKVLALASLTPLNLDQISEFKSAQESFAVVKGSGQAGLAQALSIVVNPLPQNSWMTDTAFYNVAPVQAVQTGSLYIGTNVQGATVYLNGQNLGAANVTYANLGAGTYPIRITAPGYVDYNGRVTLSGGTISNISVDLTPVITQAPVTPAPTSGNLLLDFLGSLLGNVTGTTVTVNDPARAAMDQKVRALQSQGYTLTRTPAATATGYVATMTKGYSTLTVTVERQPNRILSVQTSETTLYRY